MSKTSVVIFIMVILMIIILAACTPVVTKGPRNLNDALVDACRDSGECWSDATGEGNR